MIGIEKKKNNAQPVEEYLGDWKMQPMRAWDDVYEDLCREVGSAYGLNDIREA